MKFQFERGEADETFEDMRLAFLRHAVPVDVGEWHSQPVSSPELVSREIMDVIVTYQVPRGLDLDEIGANLPWAEDHFQERVSGRPLNPPPSNEWWPFAERGNAKHKIEGQAFSHTYPERMWPRYASDSERLFAAEEDWPRHLPHGPVNRGIRYEYGDLGDVIRQLQDNPETRQAYLPIWFPEDTGARDKQRVPCTLGYHFMIRRGELSCRYYIRSCDFMRHFKDDLYMAARLMQWVASHLPEVIPGQLTMYISSFHVFEGDMVKLRSM